MAVTVTNKQIVATLKAAKGRLWDGLNPPIPSDKERYICFAVEEADPTDAGMEVVAIIESRLAPNASVAGWLYSRGVSEEDLTTERVQAHRHAWLDLLIEEFSK